MSGKLSRRGFIAGSAAIGLGAAIQGTIPKESQAADAAFDNNPLFAPTLPLGFLNDGDSFF